MSDETTAPETSEARGLDAILAEAIDTHYVEEPAAGAPVETVAPAATEAGQSTDRPRDEQGRFISAPKEPSKEPPPGATPAKTASIDPSPTSTIEAPRNFTAEQKAEFAKLTPDAQTYIATIEKAREAEYTKRSQETAELRRTAEPLLQAVAPHQQYLEQVAQQAGLNPAAMIGSLLHTERQLRTGDPQAKVQAFIQIAQQYGVPLSALTGVQQPMQYANPQPHQAIPQYQPILEQQLAPIRQQLSALEQERKAQLNQQISQQIESFKAAKDEQGNLKYPHFERLRSTMALSLANEEVKTLEEAYTKALEPFQAVIDAEVAARNKAAEIERSQVLDKAKKAAPTKTSTGTLPKGDVEVKGLDAHLKRALDKHYG